LALFSLIQACDSPYPLIFQLRVQTVKAKAMEEIDAILALSALHEVETSPLTPETLTHMLGQAFYSATADGGRDGYLICFDQDADYDSVNFQWFKTRYPRFVYIDRVVVAAHARGQGIARRFYEALFDHARSAGHSQITCEINVLPPNPGSLAFHSALGFVEVGQADLALSKRVSYQAFML
jgi:predicted GNAT superfamily acetyltransferase